MNTRKLQSCCKGVCSIALCLCLCACSGSPESTVPETLQQSASAGEPGVSTLSTLSIPYTYSDSFNPYQAQSINNLSIMPLLYDSLLKINPKYGIDPCIAQDYSVSGNQVTLSIREGIVFTDGSSLSAEDVVYSLNQAKAGGHYASQLSSVTSISNKGNQVVVTFSSPNCLAAYLLDVPIVKKNTANSEADPIGSGRYIMHANNDKRTLEYHRQHFSHASPKFSEIALEYSPNTETTEAGIKIGTLSIANRGTSDNTMGGTGAVLQSVPATQLLYLGFNGTNGVTADVRVRQAISCVLNRTEILRAVYSDDGISSSLPIYPMLKLGDDQSSESANVDQANALLDQAGYTQRDSYGSRLAGNQAFTIDLLVPQNGAYKLVAANSIAAMLRGCGISVNTIQVDDESYTSRIAAGDFTMYLGETLQQADCSISMFLPGGSMSAGLSWSNELIEAYQKFLENSSGFANFASAFASQLPFAPLCYRNGKLVHNKTLNSSIAPSATDIFYNITDWK